MSSPRPRGRPRRAGADEEILGVVREMLGESGYGELTVDAIAERAGVAKTTVYRRWPSKGALVAAALAPANVPETAPETGSLRDDLLLVLRDTCALLRPLGAQSQPDAELIEVIVAILAPRRALLEEAIARSERSNERKLLAELLLGAILARLLISGEPLDDDCAAAAVDILLR